MRGSPKTGPYHIEMPMNIGDNLAKIIDLWFIKWFENK